MPSLRDNAAARATLNIPQALVNAGAHAIVASEPGPLVDELTSFGGEWLPLTSTTLNPIKLQRNAEQLDTLVTAERVDIVHAKNAGAAWSALVATDSNEVRLVTDLPDLARTRMRLAAFYLSALSRGDRVTARSLFSAQPIIERYRIPEGSISVVPRSIDTAAFDPTAVRPERVAALRQSWGIPSGVRVVMVPGRVAPWTVRSRWPRPRTDSPRTACAA